MRLPNHRLFEPQTRWDGFWYTRNAISMGLLPLSWLYQFVARLRRTYYAKYNRARPHLPVPVIVVGNITVGGTGKTPLVIWLARLVMREGCRPGIISRGYGGKSRVWPQFVTPDTDASKVGDESVLIARRCGCPVGVGPDRTRVAQSLLEQFDCDVLISDDGLQHYRLIRDIEIGVIDGERRFGNGCCLPAGPLREPPRRLDEVDFVVCHGKPKTHEYGMTLRGNEAVNLKQPQIRQPLEAFLGTRVNAIAGVGNPARFFTMLKESRLTISEYPFPDHYHFTPGALRRFAEAPVLMTEKDAVKIAKFPESNYWYVPVTAVPDERFAKELLNTLRGHKNG